MPPSANANSARVTHARSDIGACSDATRRDATPSSMWTDFRIESAHSSVTRHVVNSVREAGLDLQIDSRIFARLKLLFRLQFFFRKNLTIWALLPVPRISFFFFSFFFFFNNAITIYLYICVQADVCMCMCAVSFDTYS